MRSYHHPAVASVHRKSLVIFVFVLLIILNLSDAFQSYSLVLRPVTQFNSANHFQKKVRANRPTSLFLLIASNNSRYYPRNSRSRRKHEYCGEYDYSSSYPLRRTTMTKMPSTTNAISTATTSSMAWWYLTLVAVQFGCQPTLTKTFVSNTVIKSTYIFMQDIFRVCACLFLLLVSDSWHTATCGWSLTTALVTAGVPAGLYLVQSYCSLMAYQNLPPITYNVLNQTKTLSAALSCYILLGKVQSKLQIISLILLLVSALIIENVIRVPFYRKEEKPLQHKNLNHNPQQKQQEPNFHLTMGVIPVLLASLISGIAGALTQRALQHSGGGRNSYLFSMELSAFSALFMLVTLIAGSPDGRKLISNEKGEIIQGWSWSTWIPIISNAMGGIFIGLAIKHAGAVRKGIALIFGLFISGILQNFFDKKDGRVSLEQFVGGLLAAVSLWMHSNYPPLTHSKN